MKTSLVFFKAMAHRRLLTAKHSSGEVLKAISTRQAMILTGRSGVLLSFMPGSLITGRYEYKVPTN